MLWALLFFFVGSLTVLADDTDYSILGQYDYSIYDEYEEDIEDYEDEQYITDGLLKVNDCEILIPNTGIMPLALLETTKIVYNYNYVKDGITYQSTNSAMFPCDTSYQGIPTQGEMYLYLTDSSLLDASKPYDVTWSINLLGVDDFEVTSMYLVGKEWQSNSTRYEDYEILTESTDVVRVKFESCEMSDTTYILQLSYNMTPNASNIAVYTSEVVVDESSTGSFLSNILEWIKGIYNSIVELPTKIATFIGDKLKELFVPTQSQMRAYINSWDNLLAERFGAIYQVVQLLRDMFTSIIDAASGDVQDTIEMPVVELEFSGVLYEFGGWEVDVVPDGFQFLADALKFALDCVCTVAFLGALRKKYDDLMEDG